MHVCGYCSACLLVIPAGLALEGRARLGGGQCCNCQQPVGDLYGRLPSDTKVASDGVPGPIGSAGRS